jgi:DNA-binding PadR family transcriptional regulator
MVKVHDDLSPKMTEDLCLRYLAVNEEMHAKQVAEMIWLFDDNIVTSSSRTERTRNALRRLEEKGLVTSELVIVTRNNTRRYYKRVP